MAWFRTEGMTFGWLTNRFIVTMVQWRDIKKAAYCCRITVEEAERLLAQDGVMEFLQARYEVIDLENAHLAAAAAVGTETFYKARLVAMVEDPHLDHETKLKAIMVGLKANGVLTSEQKPGSGGSMVFELSFIEASATPALPPPRPAEEDPLPPRNVTSEEDDGPIIEFIEAKASIPA